MSYDLYFKVRDSQANFTRESARGFFEQRENYQLTDAHRRFSGANI